MNRKPRSQLKLFPRYCSIPGCQTKVFHFHGGAWYCKSHWQRSDFEKARSLAKRQTLSGKFSSLKMKMKRYQRESDIRLEDYADLTVNRACHYCGGALPKSGHGLDRLDGEKGYLKANCVACCTSCNTRKGHLEAAGLKYPETVEIMRRLALTSNASRSAKME